MYLVLRCVKECVKVLLIQTNSVIPLDRVSNKINRNASDRRPAATSVQVASPVSGGGRSGSGASRRIEVPKRPGDRRIAINDRGNRQNQVGIGEWGSVVGAQRWRCWTEDDGEKAIRSMDETWDEVGDEALWWQLYLAGDDHQRMAAQLLLPAMVLLFLLFLPVHLCNSLFQVRASEEVR